MDLETAVGRIEGLIRFKGVAESVFSDLESRSGFSYENSDFKERFIPLRFFHSTFYHDVGKLSQWAKTDPPDAGDYGENAKRWVFNEKLTHYGLWSMISGFGVGILAGVTSLVALPFLVIGAAGCMGVLHGRARTEMLQLTDDGRRYVNDLARYFAYDVYFNKPHLRSYRESAERYSAELKSMADELKVIGRYADADSLMDVYIEISRFRSDYGAMIGALKRGKKDPVPRWGGGISPEIITAESKLTIEHIQANFTSVIDSVKKNMQSD